MEPNTVDQRKHSRYKLIKTLVVIQHEGVRVFDLSSGGVSFGCPSDKDIPERLVVDIVDDKGLHLLDFPVYIVWIAKNQDPDTVAAYDRIVGAKFNHDLSPDQLSTLNQLLPFLNEKSRQ